MCAFTAEYPDRQKRTLRRWWTVTCGLGIGLVGGLYLAFFVPLAPQVDSLVVAVVAFLFVFPLSVLLVICLLEVFTVRISPILESRTEGVSPYAEHGLAQAFLGSKKGRAIARVYRTLVRVAEKNAFPSLADFGQASVYDKDIDYFDSQEGLEALERLIASLADEQLAIRDRAVVVAELEAVAEVLREAAKNRTRFCFAIMVR